MDIPGLLRIIGADLATIAVITVAIGASAPRWPGRWLSSDAGPLRLTRLDAPHLHRRARTAFWARRLPELGHVFGGASKRQAPARTPDAIDAYLVECRRAEWVHWLSNLSLLPLLAWNPWWMWLAFALVTLAVNFVFIAILRHNRQRLLGIRERSVPGA